VALQQYFLVAHSPDNPQNGKHRFFLSGGYAYLQQGLLG
jgi:hypothetical protein